MLKNKDLSKLNKVHTLLGLIWVYTIDTDNNELYEQTGITSKDIHEAMQIINHIHSTEVIKHVVSNEKSNAYNKAHPERHRELNREYARRRREKAKGGEQHEQEL